MPFENFAGVDGHKGFESLVFGMKVSGRVIRVIHANVDSKEIRNDGHRDLRWLVFNRIEF
jgi:hypothetical protein